MKLLLLLIGISVFSSCAVLNRPDNVHEELYNQGNDSVMSKDINFGGR